MYSSDSKSIQNFVSKSQSMRKRLLRQMPDYSPSRKKLKLDKMANDLNSLHLSSNYTSHGVDSADDIISENDLDVTFESYRDFPTLKVCDELKSLTKSIDYMIPEKLFPNLSRPTNALVLWKPPVKINDIFEKSKNSENENEAISSNLNNASSNILKNTDSVTSVADIEMSEEQEQNNNNNTDSYVL